MNRQQLLAYQKMKWGPAADPVLQPVTKPKKAGRIDSVSVELSAEFHERVSKLRKRTRL